VTPTGSSAVVDVATLHSHVPKVLVAARPASPPAARFARHSSAGPHERMVPQGTLHRGSGVELLRDVTHMQHQVHAPSRPMISMMNQWAQATGTGTPVAGNGHVSREGTIWSNGCSASVAVPPASGAGCSISVSPSLGACKRTESCDAKAPSGAVTAAEAAASASAAVARSAVARAGASPCRSPPLPKAAVATAPSQAPFPSNVRHRAAEHRIRGANDAYMYIAGPIIAASSGGQRSNSTPGCHSGSRTGNFVGSSSAGRLPPTGTNSPAQVGVAGDERQIGLREDPEKGRNDKQEKVSEAGTRSVESQESSATFGPCNPSLHPATWSNNQAAQHKHVRTWVVSRALAANVNNIQLSQGRVLAHVIDEQILKVVAADGTSNVVLPAVGERLMLVKPYIDLLRREVLRDLAIRVGEGKLRAQDPRQAEKTARGCVAQLERELIMKLQPPHHHTRSRRHSPAPPWATNFRLQSSPSVDLQGDPQVCARWRPVRRSNANDSLI